jgi:hypothetical protein
LNRTTAVLAIPMPLLLAWQAPSGAGDHALSGACDLMKSTSAATESGSVSGSTP